MSWRTPIHKSKQGHSINSSTLRHQMRGHLGCLGNDVQQQRGHAGISGSHDWGVWGAQGTIFGGSSSFGFPPVRLPHFRSLIAMTMLILRQRTEDLHWLAIADNMLSVDTIGVSDCPPSSTANPLDDRPKRRDPDINKFFLSHGGQEWVGEVTFSPSSRRRTRDSQPWSISRPHSSQSPNRTRSFRCFPVHFASEIS